MIVHLTVHEYIVLAYLQYLLVNENLKNNILKEVSMINDNHKQKSCYRMQLTVFLLVICDTVHVHTLVVAYMYITELLGQFLKT